MWFHQISGYFPFLKRPISSNGRPSQESEWKNHFLVEMGSLGEKATKIDEVSWKMSLCIKMKRPKPHPLLNDTCLWSWEVSATSLHALYNSPRPPIGWQTWLGGTNLTWSYTCIVQQGVWLSLEAAPESSSDHIPRTTLGRSQCVCWVYCYKWTF